MTKKKDSIPRSIKTGDKPPASKNVSLYESVEEQISTQNFLWNLLVDICIKLQISSASIKAGVTSLLDHTIFWAQSTQYDFLRSIDESIDVASDLTALIMLAFRVQAGRLEMNIGPQDLNEILAQLRDQGAGVANGVQLDIQFPQEAAGVKIDYGYLLMAIKLLIQAETSVQNSPVRISIRSNKQGESWVIDIGSLKPESLHFLQQLVSHTQNFQDYDHHQAEWMVRQMLAYWLCRLQQIEFMVDESNLILKNSIQISMPMD